MKAECMVLVMRYSDKAQVAWKGKGLSLIQVLLGGFGCYGNDF